MSKKKWWLYIAIAGLLVGCGSAKEISYLQDINEYEQIEAIGGEANTIRPGDLLSIVVTSSKPELAVPYNLFNIRGQVYANGVGASTPYLEGYTVDSRGMIDFPTLGEMRVEGLTREQLAASIKERLQGAVPDPVVTVTFMNFRVTVIGEVNRPGTFNIQNDRVTLLEALGMAGDMTVYGRRDNILVIRDVDGYRETARLNIKSKKIFDSPFYYLKQNDVVFVEPINAKANTRSTFRTNFPLFVSIGSLLTSIAMVIFYFKK